MCPTRMLACAAAEVLVPWNMRFPGYPVAASTVLEATASHETYVQCLGLPASHVLPFLTALHAASALTVCAVTFVYLEHRWILDTLDLQRMQGVQIMLL